MNDNNESAKHCCLGFVDSMLKNKSHLNAAVGIPITSESFKSRGVDVSYEEMGGIEIPQFKPAKNN